MPLLPVKINQSALSDRPKGGKSEYKLVTFGFRLCIVIIHCDQWPASHQWCDAARRNDWI